MKKVLLLSSILSIFSCAPDFEKPREINSPVVIRDSIHVKDTIQEKIPEIADVLIHVEPNE